MGKNAPLAIVILAAGKGTRMKSDSPKVMHELAGKPMINWLIDTCAALKPEKIITVIGPDMPELAKAVSPHKTVIQKTRDGTGGALKCALPALKKFKGNVLVLLGDTPLICLQTLKSLITAKGANAASILGCTVDDSTGYGRLVLGGAGELLEIVEEKDASAKQKQIKLINTGAFCLDGGKLENWLSRVDNKNAQKEFYITQIPALIRKDGGNTSVAITNDEDEIRGCNTRVDLAALEQTLQIRLRENAMLAGVRMSDPDTVYLWHDTKIAEGVSIEPNVFFGAKVTIEKGAQIKAFSHIEDAKIKAGVSIGPFARIRGGSVLGEDVKIGNFVELKNANLSKGVKASHLTYLGDTDIGAGSNIGAGTITCNYNGFEKNKTEIGENVFIGSNSALVAPVKIQNGALIAAGSTITENIPKDSLAMTRAKLEIKKGWAAKFRKLKAAAKSKKAAVVVLLALACAATPAAAEPCEGFARSMGALEAAVLESKIQTQAPPGQFSPSNQRYTPSNLDPRVQRHGIKRMLRPQPQVIRTSSQRL